MTYRSYRALNDELELEPLAASIPTACRYSGLTRSEIYRRLGTGDIRAVKQPVINDTARAERIRQYRGFPGGPGEKAFESMLRRQGRKSAYEAGRRHGARVAQELGYKQEIGLAPVSWRGESLGSE